MHEIAQANVERTECEYVNLVCRQNAFRRAPVPGDKLVFGAVFLQARGRFYFDAIPMVFVIRDDVTTVCADNGGHAAEALD